MRIFSRKKILNIDLNKAKSISDLRKAVETEVINNALIEVKSFLAKNVKEKQDKSFDTTDFIIDIDITTKEIK